MSQAKDDGWDDPVEVDSQSQQSQYLDYEPGDTPEGEITDVNLERGYHGSIWVDGKEFKLNKTTRKQLLEALIKGSDVRIEVGTEEQSFTNDDGEEVTYYNKQLRFR